MKKEYFYIIIYNIINIICWCALAIIFNKWWIMIFACLTTMTWKDKEGYYRICDKCGKRSESAESYNEALVKAKKAGWVHYEGVNTDYCPECQDEFN
jgi:hypothetical protein